MGGAYERLTLYTPLISPLNPPHTHCVWGGGGQDDPGNGEGMGGDWKRDTFQTPLISPLTPPHNVCGGEGGQRVFLGGQKKERESFIFTQRG